MTAELVVDARNMVGESPVWHAGESALYWSDIPACRLHRWSAADGRHTEWTLPEQLACFAPDCQGGWIGGMQTGIFAMQLPADGPAVFSPRASVTHAESGMRFNDGRCDRQGRFLAGTMQSNMQLNSHAGVLYRYDQARGLVALLDDLATPNGLAFSPDGSTLYLSDSHPGVQKIWSFDYDLQSGTPSNRRLFVDMAPLPGRPDGAAMDSAGCYWICGNDAGLVHRFTPAGKLDRSLAVPVKKPAMCSFGGPGLDTLYVTSIRPSGVDLSDQPLAGGVFALRPGIAGVPETAFGA